MMINRSASEGRVVLSIRSPVALIIFRRPELTEKVFERIAEAKPPKLFIFADGPAADRPGEAEKCRDDG